MIRLIVPKISLLDPAKATQTFDRIQSGFFLRALTIMANTARTKTPQGATGNLLHSIRGEAVNPYSVRQTRLRLTWNTPYAQAVNSGSRAHWAPLDRLRLWAAFKGWNPQHAIRLQRHIAMRGTRPNRYLARTQRAVRGPVVNAFRQLIGALGRALRR